MPSSNPSSSDSPPPSATPADAGDATTTEAPRRLAWRANLWLFLATVASVFVTGAVSTEGTFFERATLVYATQFTVALLAILLAHEFGHYIAARIHKVEATLPFFIPMPIVSPFGTMGAVIRMSGKIRTRAALLDIGASGPLAGLVLAIPIYLWGVTHPHFVAVPEMTADSSVSFMYFGDSILTRVFDHLGPDAPAGTYASSPFTMAGWAGMFVTMINLIPVGQLDGGHIAYALFGPRQDRIAQWVHRSMLAFFFVSLITFLLRDVRAGIGLVRIGKHVYNSMFWLTWFEILAVLGSLSARGTRQDDEKRLDARTRLIALVTLFVFVVWGREKSSPFLWLAWFASLGVLLAMEVKWGVLRPNTLLDHPPTGEAKLGVGRAAIAILSLVLFALLFMPTPIAL